MAIYVYDISTGALVSWCPNDTDPVASDAQLVAKGLTKVVGLPSLDTTHAWDASQKTVITVPASVLPNEVKTGDWVMQFTADEHAIIASSTDKNVTQFLYALQCSPTINLNSPLVQGGLAYLASINLLTQTRTTALGSWTETT